MLGELWVDLAKVVNPFSRREYSHRLRIISARHAEHHCKVFECMLELYAERAGDLRLRGLHNELKALDIKVLSCRTHLTTQRIAAVVFSMEVGDDEPNFSFLQRQRTALYELL